MVNVPIELIELEARRDGLKGDLNIEFRPGVANTYNRRSGVIKLRPYPPKLRWRMAQVLAHEIKHKIDLDKLPWWLVELLYWPVIAGIGVAFGWTQGFWWGLLAGFVVYLLHPFEISANLYALRKWRRYLEILNQ